ncbi:hypothetical protein THASP1DRAFT_30478 [Thamnocephalis sphaerospora]|uniref:GATA-type domain-containing protein n=1 Tax=Thamnocephalis sphaerospora TaxID=78915 RepID=A0A4P9XPB4_9FUNG|nr:hypothetical protein THASP1DRAFT_30478 [Thamnocephalis sphaerospora]|eukprot:RKP07712.1 hypothetical protein THASP1DRAFT_30478 [Thamnocephalis sphaerospora]
MSARAAHISLLAGASSSPETSTCAVALETPGALGTTPLATSAMLSQASFLPSFFGDADMSASANSAAAAVAAAAAAVAAAANGYPPLSAQEASELLAASSQNAAACFDFGGPRDALLENGLASGNSSVGAPASPGVSDAGPGTALAASAFDAASTNRPDDPSAAQVWRMYHRAREQLPNASRVENLTWRIMALSLKRKRAMEEVRRSQDDAMDMDTALPAELSSSSSSSLMARSPSNAAGASPHAPPATSMTHSVLATTTAAMSGVAPAAFTVPASSTVYSATGPMINGPLSPTHDAGVSFSNTSTSTRVTKTPARPSLMLERPMMMRAHTTGHAHIQPTSTLPLAHAIQRTGSSIIIPADDTYRATPAMPFVHKAGPDAACSHTSAFSMSAPTPALLAASSSLSSSGSAISAAAAAASSASTSASLFSPSAMQNFPFTFHAELGQQLRHQTRQYQDATSAAHAAAYATLAAAAVAIGAQPSASTGSSDMGGAAPSCAPVGSHTTVPLGTSSFTAAAAAVSPFAPTFAIGGIGRGGGSGDGGGGDDVGGWSCSIGRANSISLAPQPTATVSAPRRKASAADATAEVAVSASSHGNVRDDGNAARRSASREPVPVSFVSTSAAPLAATSATNVALTAALAPPSAPADDGKDKKDASVISCRNCETTVTPLWRRDPEGRALCNACGLFLKLHGILRPKSLKTDVIKKRNRRPRPTPTANPSVLRPALPVRQTSSANGTNTPRGNMATNSAFSNPPPSKRARPNGDQPGMLMTSQPLGTTPEQSMAMAIAERLHQQRVLAAARLAADRVARAEERHGGYYAGHALASSGHDYAASEMSISGFWFGNAPAYSGYDEFGPLAAGDPDVEMH